VGKDRQCVLAFNDASGMTRGMLGLGEKDKPLLILRGHEALVGINDLTGITRALMGTSKDGEGMVIVQDKAGKGIAQLP
jgi:hypothetical protein